MSSSRVSAAVLALLALATSPPSLAAEGSRLLLAVRVPASVEDGPLDGRLLLLL